MLKSTSRTADFLNRKMPGSPFSVVMLHCELLPWLQSPACSMEVAPLLLGEKPETRAVNPINLLQLNLTRNWFIPLCPIILSSCSKDFKIKALSYSYYTKYTARGKRKEKKRKRKKNPPGLQISCWYKQTEMQCNSASNGWGLHSLCPCWEYRMENRLDRSHWYTKLELTGTTCCDAAV